MAKQLDRKYEKDGKSPRRRNKKCKDTQRHKKGLKMCEEAERL